MKQFKLGLVINRIAGIGGSVALKGSDGVGVAEQAIALGATAKSNARASLALEILLPYKDNMTIYTVSSDMGESTAKALGFTTQVVHQVENKVTTERDTELAVKALIDEGIDLLLFAGGDGTARNVCHIVDDKFPVLGIPAGCKIHSGVYAITPKAAGRVVELMITNQLVSLTDADVMDIDESLFREGIVKAKRFGEMVLQDIAADVIAKMDDELFIIGSGSTTAFVMEELALENTLLGVDAICQQTLIASDLTEADLWQLMQPYKLGQIKLVITLIGGQGHIFGRGNQQLSPRIIRAIKKENIMIIATKAKLNALQARPLIADTGDSELDMELSGYLPVITGYNDQVLYPVASPQ